MFDTENASTMVYVHPEREPGESPGLSRSGMQERPPSQALVTRLGSDGH
jgi:hypothetical protein